MRILLGSLGTLTIRPWGGLRGLAFVELRRFVGQDAKGCRMLGGHDFFVLAQEGVDGFEQIANHKRNMVLHFLEAANALLSHIQKNHGRPTFVSIWHLAQQIYEALQKLDHKDHTEDG